jgi:Fur family transcriptional regulator, ferric uptake regulator
MAIKAQRERLRALLRDRGLRVTSSRLGVLEFLRSHADHPMSHAEVTAALSGESWDPATIYRNLLDLVGAGLARRTDVGDRVFRFEAVDEAHTAGHPHFVCTECGGVQCLPDLGLVVPRTKTPRALKRREIELQVRGRCDRCA